MSNDHPEQPSSGQPEYLSPGSPAAGPADGQTEDAPRRSRRTAVVAASAVAVVAALGVGTYGLVQLMSGGSQAATAVPANALGYLSLDLDPSASQKVEAFKIMRKFPALKKELKLGAGDDIRKSVFEQIVKDSDCKDLSYADDVEPWIGDRVAVAAVPDSEHVAAPMVALQVKDEAKAKAGMRKLEGCDSSRATDQEPDRTGISFVGDYAVIAETQAEADRFANQAESASLADDSAYTEAMDRAGDSGIITMYAAKEAADAVSKSMADGASGADKKTLDKAFKDFQGMTGVVRFNDGAVEAEFTGKGLPSQVGLAGGDGPDVTTLPATTGALLSLTLKDGWFADLEDGIKQAAGPDYDSMLSQAEQQTGLKLPEDVETLLGKGFSISVDGSADIEKLSQSPDPSQVPAGIRITGDPAKITPIIDKLKAAAGPQADLVKVASGDGAVAVGFEQGYVDELLKKGTLGDDKAFSGVVPEAGKAKGVFYLDFDAGDGWADQVADLVSDGDPEVKANVEPLHAFAVSSWLDSDNVGHGLLRLSTD